MAESPMAGAGAGGDMGGGAGVPTGTPIAPNQSGVMNGDGLELIALAGSGAFFDLDEDGFRENVQWLAGDDGLLARDVNQNGRISLLQHAPF